MATSGDFVTAVDNQDRLADERTIAEKVIATFHTFPIPEVAASAAPSSSGATGSDAPIACQAFGEGEFQAAASQAL